MITAGTFAYDLFACETIFKIDEIIFASWAFPAHLILHRKDAVLSKKLTRQRVKISQNTNSSINRKPTGRPQHAQTQETVHPDCERIPFSTTISLTRV